MWNEEKPILKISLIEGVNLNIFDESIQPFLVFSSGSEVVKSKVATLSNEKYVWNEKLSLILDPDSPLIISLYTFQDQEELFLEKTSYEFSDVSCLKKNHNSWVAFAMSRKQQSLSFQITGILVSGIKRETGKSPQVNLSFTFMHNNYLRIVEAKVESHKVILKSKDIYTLYYISVLRNDGKRWIKPVRYSEIFAFRTNLEDIEPRINEIEFPSKTYFEILACVWPTLSRFHPQVIEKRSVAIEKVINYVIDRYRNIGIDALNNLLNE